MSALFYGIILVNRDGGKANENRLYTCHNTFY